MHPPSDNASLRDWLRLALAPEIGPKTAHCLIERFGSPSALFQASPTELGDGLAQHRLTALFSSATEKSADEELRLAEKHGVGILSLDSPDYPAGLRDLPFPPLIVYVRGELHEADRLSLSVVGPRKPSEYGRLMASRLVPPLCAVGLTIVSGLAYGIDAEAHRAALDCEGRTIAVLGQGLAGRVYPAANAKLARRIADEGRGAVLSVFPLATEPNPGLFPRRNEIIAAFSLGSLIVEAGEKSGALITADRASELGRPVMACPGDATRPTARGSNRLIADGAALVQKSDDVLGVLAPRLKELRPEIQLGADGDCDEELGTQRDFFEADGKPTASRKPPVSGDPLEARIAALLGEEHQSLDVILEGCAREGFDQSAVIQKLLGMEMAGRIRQMPGRIYMLTQ